MAVSNGTYSYYYLLSGEDLPIKTQDEIHNFFENAQGKEFIRFEKDHFVYDDRVRLYHLFQEQVGRPGEHRVLFKLNMAFLALQKKIGVYRNKEIEFQKGTNWFSITNELANYVVQQEVCIQELFKNTLCCDEVFLQTIVHNSKFKENLYHKVYDNDLCAIQREIDWTRGKPYIFRKSDFDELIASDMLFARKFNCIVDKEIIKMIQNRLLKSNC